MISFSTFNSPNDETQLARLKSLSSNRLNINIVRDETPKHHAKRHLIFYRLVKALQLTCSLHAFLSELWMEQIANNFPRGVKNTIVQNGKHVFHFGEEARGFGTNSNYVQTHSRREKNEV
jgi:hypothetical protein